MAGCVEQVHDAVPVRELEHGRGDRDAALLLELHPVRGRRAPTLPGLDRAGAGGQRTAVEQELLGERGLAGVGVRDDRERAAPGRLRRHPGGVGSGRMHDRPSVPARPCGPTGAKRAVLVTSSQPVRLQNASGLPTGPVRSVVTRAPGSSHHTRGNRFTHAVPDHAGLSRRSFLLTGTAALGRAAARRSPLDPRAAARRRTDARRPPSGSPSPTSRRGSRGTSPSRSMARSSWTDTYGACRDGCSRRHEGQDLMAQKLTRLVACCDGTRRRPQPRVRRQQHLPRGRRRLVLRVPPHQQRHARSPTTAPTPSSGRSRPARRSGAGWTGASSSPTSATAATPSPPGRTATSRSASPPRARACGSSQAVNAKYSLDAAKPPPPRVPPETFEPWDNSRDLILQQYVDFFGRSPDAECAQLLPARARPGGAQPRLAHPGAAPVRGVPARRPVRSCASTTPTSAATPTSPASRYWVGSVRAAGGWPRSPSTSPRRPSSGRDLRRPLERGLRRHRVRERARARPPTRAARASGCAASTQARSAAAA